MDPETTSSTEETAATLNFCDRVEILNMMMHDNEKPLSLDDMDTLLSTFYPSYRQLCEELRGDSVVSSAQAILSEESVDFHVKFVHGGDYSVQYNQIEQDLS